MGSINEVFQFEQNALSLHSPLESLIAEYRADREKIERIAEYVQSASGVVEHFLAGMQTKYGYGRLTAESVFKTKHAFASLNASYWSRAISMTDVLDSMPAERRNEWNRQIRELETPEFEADSVRSTLQELLAMRSTFFAERVDGLFRALSGEHVTNAPEAFRKRMIIAGMLSYSSIDHNRANYIHDLREVIARFMGRDSARAHSTYKDLSEIISSKGWGKWYSFDGGAFRVRLYKCSTCHIEIHPDMAWRLNGVLAWKYPNAIPSEFRTKPKKKQKEYPLDHNLLSFEALRCLDTGSLSREGDYMSFMSTPSPSVADALRFVGGVSTVNGTSWNFDYNAHTVIREILRTGQLPEARTHQFYPTQEGLAKKAVEEAGIEPEDDVLEPSGGQAGIARFLPVEQTTTVEISALNCAVLKAKGFDPIQTDFLTWQPGRLFSKIVMNPPFSSGRAIAHLNHAVELLAPRGRLVAILPGSYHGKELIPGMKHRWGEVMTDTFPGTSVTVSMLILDHP